MSRYVIPDIHGCAKTFVALIERIGLNKDDSLYLLGDYIDRGKNSSGVLDTIIDLKQQGYNVFALRGNHEENVLKAEQQYDVPTFVHFVKRINKSGDLLSEDGLLISKYREFFKTLPYYYDLDDYILVHAGLNVTLANPFDDIVSLIELRKFNETENHLVIGKKKIIHGHVPFYINDIISNIEKQKQIIPLDNGCVYTKKHKMFDYTQLGSLLCLELDNFTLTIQKNVD